MHAVDGNKLLWKRVGDSKVILLRTRNAADDLTFTDAPEKLVDLFACQSPPVGVHADVQRGVIENGGRPVDRVDLCHKGHIDKKSSSDQDGYSLRSRSQMALCSSVNSVCIKLRPIHQLPLRAAISIPSSPAGSKPSAPMFSLPSLWERTLSCVFLSLP